MIVEDTLLQYRARQRHQRKRLWSSFDDSGFEAFGTFGLGVGGDGAEEFLSQTAPCLAGALSHFGGEAQGGSAPLKDNRIECSPTPWPPVARTACCINRRTRLWVIAYMVAFSPPRPETWHG